jgi:hypothetical protein
MVSRQRRTTADMIREVTKTGLWKLPRYGNREKQSAFFLRSHSAGKTRPKTSSFPQLPQPLPLDIYQSKTMKH